MRARSVSSSPRPSELGATEAADAIWSNARIAPMRGDDPADDLPDGAIAVRGGRIAWIGDRRGLPPALRGPRTKDHDAERRWITPGLIDCHTHLVFGGNRAQEWERRLQGATYEQIARGGGGIHSTVRETRAAYEEELFEAARRRLRYLLAEGVTTVEIKSGYGLELESEMKILRVARSLGERLPVSVHTTFLGAHAVPPRFEGQADRYVDEVCERMLPRITGLGLADAVDVFCERIAFDLPQTERLFKTAARLGLPVKIHAEQLSHTGGARLAARYGALSVDHLEHADEEDVAELAAAGTVAVLLPGAFYFLREQQVPPVGALRRHAVPIAISTDCNPGTSPLTSILHVLNLACTLFGLTPREALAGVTRNAAAALGASDEAGTLEPGKWADFVLWDIDRPADLAYEMGANPCAAVIRRGVERSPARLREA